MLLFLSTPYSQAPDKQALMDEIYAFALDVMKNNPQIDVVSPLFLHPGLHLRPEMRTDYDFWESYCKNLLSRCDGILVYQPKGTDVSRSTGVLAEIESARLSGIPHFEGLPGGFFRCIL